jgi:hypothetical protein
MLLRDTYILWSLDIKNQEAFYQGNVNWGDVLQGMPVIVNNYTHKYEICIYVYIYIYIYIYYYNFTRIYISLITKLNQAMRHFITKMGLALADSFYLH